MIATIIFRPLIILVLLVVSIIFVLQNQQSLALVFFGTKTIQLSLAVWVLIFTGAGVLTSLLLQLLYRSSTKTSANQSKNNISPPDSPVSPPRTQRSVREVFGQKAQPSDFQRFSEDTTSSTPSKTDTEWDIETPPSQPTLSKDEQRKVELNLPQDPSRTFEVQQQPKTTSREGSVYSYSYRETKPSEDRPSDQVYDANYRVINPPDRETPQSTNKENEDEDWI